MTEERVIQELDYIAAREKALADLGGVTTADEFVRVISEGFPLPDGDRDFLDVTEYAAAARRILEKEPRR